jgi:hypothetical protein
MGQFWRGCSALPLEHSAALNVGASPNAKFLKEDY